MKEDLIIKKFGSIKKFNALLESDFQLENFFSMDELISHLKEKNFVFENIFLEKQKEYFYINMNRIIFLENRNIRILKQHKIIKQEIILKIPKLEITDIFFLMKKNPDFFVEKDIVFLLKNDRHMNDKYLKVLIISNKEIKISNFGALSFNFSKENYICE